jgi:hypothetical protein
MSARGSIPVAADSELKKSIKIADPELFNNNKNSKFKYWLSRMRNKLKSNTNYFPTEDLRMAYVKRQTKGVTA